MPYTNPYTDGCIAGCIVFGENLPPARSLNAAERGQAVLEAGPMSGGIHAKRHVSF